MKNENWYENILTLISEDGKEIIFGILKNILYEDVNYIVGRFFDEEDTELHVLEIDEYEDDIDLIEVENEEMKHAILALLK